MPEEKVVNKEVENKQADPENSAVVNIVLTVDQVNEKLEAIRQLVKEKHPVIASEEAHELQDKLLRAVLEGIANGAAEPVELSKAAIDVFNIEFTRWYS